VNVCKTLRPYFNGLLVGNDSFNRESGLQKIANGDCDAISFGQWFITNPDLPERLIKNYPINTQLDKTTFYGNANGSKGYTEYKPYQNA
jgi:2,4-dienoyl-CoA reductase-like NADH-dependent reductase (Old Yellow Enzyme family)